MLQFIHDQDDNNYSQVKSWLEKICFFNQRDIEDCKFD
jgi:hypothetical protein